MINGEINLFKSWCDFHDTANESNETPLANQLLRTDQVALILNFDVTYVYRICKQDKIKYIKKGRTIFIWTSDFAKYFVNA